MQNKYINVSVETMVSLGWSHRSPDATVIGHQKDPADDCKGSGPEASRHPHGKSLHEEGLRGMIGHLCRSHYYRCFNPKLSESAAAGFEPAFHLSPNHYERLHLTDYG